MSDPHNVIAHTASAGGIMGALFGWLPPVLGVLAAAAAFIWYMIQIYESVTFQRLSSWVAARWKSPAKPKDPDFPDAGLLD